MEADPLPVRLSATEVVVDGSRGPLPVASAYAVVVDESGLTLSGGEPVAAWQIPHSATSGVTMARRGAAIEVGAWVAGGHVRLTIPEHRLVGGSAEDLGALLGVTPSSREPAVTPPRPRQRRSGWLVVGLGALLVVIGAVIVIAAVSGGSTSSSAAVSPADHAATAARNLVVTDLPAGWGEDSPSTAPLAGLLGTGTSSQATTGEKAVTKKVITAYQSCMGITSTADRVFGAAGVTPALQLSSSPVGTISGSTYLEAGTSTQRYASVQSVRADLVQLRSPRFSTCFAEAIGRLSMNAGLPENATPALSLIHI